MPKNIEVLHHFITYCRAGAALLLGGLFYLLFLYHFRVLQPNSNAFHYHTTAIRFTGRLFFSF